MGTATAVTVPDSSHDNHSPGSNVTCVSESPATHSGDESSVLRESPLHERTEMSGQVLEADTIGAASSVATECDPGGTDTVEVGSDPQQSGAPTEMVESRGGTHSRSSGVSTAKVDAVARDGERVVSGPPTEPKKGKWTGRLRRRVQKTKKIAEDG